MVDLLKSAAIIGHAALGHHARVAVSAREKPMRQTHTVLFLEASGDQQHRFGLRTPRARFQRDTEVDDRWNMVE